MRGIPPGYGPAVPNAGGSWPPGASPGMQAGTDGGAGCGGGYQAGTTPQGAFGTAGASSGAVSTQRGAKFDPKELMLLETLGEGAQADVHKAVWWRSFGVTTAAITVAVKRLRGGATRTLECEAVVGKINHPNLVRCFEATVEPPFFIISEYCDGGSLYDLIRSSRMQLSWQQRLKALLDVAEGMWHLHSQNPIIIHRDLKSCNVLLSKRLTPGSSQLPHAKVADFGLSRNLKGQDMTLCVGTWRWMAPEVISSSDYNERVDVFSFAMLIYEVISWIVPYADRWPEQAKVNPAIGLQIVNGYRPSVDRVQKGCPSMITQYMKRCWAQEPQRRPDFDAVRKFFSSQLQLVALYGQMKKQDC